MTTLRTDSTHSSITIDYADGSYRPAYKSVAQWQQDKVTADPMDGVTFRSNMGVPYAIVNGDIVLRGEPLTGETPVYAHMAETDSTTKVVGKLNLLTFEPREISVCLVPVNGASLPNIQTLEAELNKIFKPAVASVKVSSHAEINIEYANGSAFVHGGSGPLTVYSDDEKAAINALTDANDDTYYLFLVSSVTKLDADGNNTVVSGYMPVGYQHGFIFEQFDVARTFAHELSHGAFALHHTFSANTESFRADEGTTNNLMDYTQSGTTLNHKQWRWMHEKHGSGLFGFLADDEEGEATGNAPVLAIHNVVWETLKEDKEGLFITPSGAPIYLSLKGNTPVAVMKNAEVGNTELRTDAIYGFEIEGTKYMAEIQGNTFNGYFKVNEQTTIQYTDYRTVSIVPESGAYNVWSWDVEKNKFEQRQQIFSVNNHNERIFYDSTTRKILIVTDVRDLRWFSTKDGKDHKLSDIQDNWSDVQILTEAELFDKENSSLQNMMELSFDSFVDKIVAEYHFAVNRMLPIPPEHLVNITADEIVVLLLGSLWVSNKIDNETFGCIYSTWFEEGSIALKKRILQNPVLLVELSNAYINGGLNKMYDVAEKELSDLFEDGTPVAEKITKCLITYAKNLCPDVESLGENQKKKYFETSAEKTVGILLYEFATGTGLSERTFSNIDEPCPFVDMYASGRIVDEIKEDLKNMNLTYSDFMKKKDGVRVSLELTPGNELGIRESFVRHFNSNLEQIYIGGAAARVFPTENKSIVKVVVSNITGKNSLFLHVATDSKRNNYNASNEALSNITQVLIFNITINEDTFK